MGKITNILTAIGTLVAFLGTTIELLNFLNHRKEQKMADLSCFIKKPQKVTELYLKNEGKSTARNISVKLNNEEEIGDVPYKIEEKIGDINPQQITNVGFIATVEDKDIPITEIVVEWDDDYSSHRVKTQKVKI